MEDKPKKKGMSEFFRKVARASWQSGWSTPKDSCSPFEKQFLVSEGEYAGTWLFERSNGQLRYKYTPDLLAKDEANMSSAFALLNWKKNQLSEFNRNAYLIQKLDWTTKPEKVLISKKSERRDYTYTFYEKSEYSDERLLCSIALDTTFGKNAIVLAARAGYDPVWLRQELTKVPGRVVSLKTGVKVCKLLRSHKDRVSFSKKLLNTWSVNKSLPAWVKRPERWKKLLALGIKQDAFTPLDWIKLVPRKWTGIRHASEKGGLETMHFLSVHIKKGEFKSLLGRNPKISEQREIFKKLLNPRSLRPAWRVRQDDEILMEWHDEDHQVHPDLYPFDPDWSKVYVTDLRDGMNEWHDLALRPQDWPLVDPDNEWIPRVQDAVEKQKFYVFYELHDEISTATRTLRQLDWEQQAGRRTLGMKADLEKAELHHQGLSVTADNLKFPCSCEVEFKVMSTYEEFLDEGREMHHCIASYFVNHRGKHLLSVKGKDGERSSAEVAFHPEFEPKVHQHRGFANGQNPSEHTTALHHHLSHCLKDIPDPEEEEKKGIIQGLIDLILNR